MKFRNGKEGNSCINEKRLSKNNKRTRPTAVAHRDESNRIIEEAVNHGLIQEMRY